MVITDEDLIRTTDAICFGHRIVTIELDNDVYTFIFRPLALRERNIANFVYEQALQEAIRNDLPQRSELRAQMLLAGIWDQIQDVKLERLKKEIQNLDQERRETKLKSKKKKITRFINEAIEELSQLHDIKFKTIDAPSREYYAEQAKSRYIIAVTTLSFPSMEQKWGSLESLDRSHRTGLIDALMLHYYRYEPVAEEIMRKIARSGYWRMKWMNAHKSAGIGCLFSNDLADLTLDQFNLIHWTQFYDAIYSAFDRPPDSIIEDNKLIDEWFEEKLEEQREESKNKFNEHKMSRRVRLKGLDASEVGVVVDGFYSDKCICDKPGGRHARHCTYGVFMYYTKDYKNKEVAEIQASNPETVRYMLAKEQDIIAEHGSIKEQDLRKHNTQSRKLLGMETKIHEKK